MFGDMLKIVREDHDDTQATLAQKLGVAKSTVSNWEQNKCEPSYELLCKICESYEVTADYLLGRKTENRQKRKQLFDSLSEENQNLVIRVENLLLLEQKLQTKK